MTEDARIRMLTAGADALDRALERTARVSPTIEDAMRCALPDDERSAEFTYTAADATDDGEFSYGEAADDPYEFAPLRESPADVALIRRKERMERIQCRAIARREFARLADMAINALRADGFTSDEIREAFEDALVRA